MNKQITTILDSITDEIYAIEECMQNSHYKNANERTILKAQGTMLQTAKNLIKEAAELGQY
jgi:hypothetical protein